MAAVALVAALVALAAGAPFLFESDAPPLFDAARNDGDGGEPTGESSVYASALVTAADCLPDPAAFSSPGGSASVKAIADDVERLRGLRFRDEPNVAFMTPAALAARVERRSEHELDRARVDVEVEALAKLRIVPEDFSFDDFVEGVSGAVLGLYEPRTERLLVAGSGSPAPREQMIIAHELDHALTDQLLGFPDLRPKPLREDAQTAERALIEGDATLLMQHYAAVEFPGRLEELLSGGGTPEQQSEFETLPYVLRRSLAFPYQEGYLFTCSLYSRGGWTQIDRAYADPPSSTLEILFPGVYGEIDVEVPRRPRSPGAGWLKVSAFAFGAADLQWILEAPGGEPGGSPAAAAQQVSRWRGGRMHLWQRDDALVIALSIVEGPDLTGSAPTTLCDRLVRWHVEAFPEADFIDGRGARGAWRNDDDVTLVDCEGDQTRYVVAPDLKTAMKVTEF